MALRALIFVHRGLFYCNAVARAIVALLGRFLPRLGPLLESGPFFWAILFSGVLGLGGLFGRGAVRPQLLQRDLAQTPGHRLQVGRKPCEPADTLVTAFVHVERAVDLELDGMEARGRVAVMLGDEAAGIGLVAAHGVAQRPQRRFHGFRHDADATGAIAVAEHEFRAWSFVLLPRG